MSFHTRRTALREQPDTASDTSEDDMSSDDYVQPPPWEMLIDKQFAHIKARILEYFDTDHFKFEWLLWNAHQGGVCSRFRDMIRYYLGIDSYEKEHNKFPVNTKTLHVIMRVIEHSLCAQMNFMYRTIPNAVVDNMVFVKAMCRSIVDESFDRLEPGSHPSLLGDLYTEYETIWKAAERIQIQWRNAISDPSYGLCRKRLHREYCQLQGSV